jgi:hypothetical protein
MHALMPLWLKSSCSEPQHTSKCFKLNADSPEAGTEIISGNKEFHLQEYNAMVT